MALLNNISSGDLPAPFGEPGKPGWSPWLLAALCAAVAALLLPRQAPFPYRYETGQPWNYRDLKAPFDFEVLYPEEQVRDELARVNAEHGPYFLQNNELARRQKRRLAELVEAQARISQHDPQFADLAANPGTYASFGQELLDKIYAVGVVSPESEGFRFDDPNLAVYLWADNVERRVPLGSLLTVDKARDFLTDSLPFSPLRQPEMLLPLLEKVLVPNVFYSDSLTQAIRRRKLAAVMSTGVAVRKDELVVQRNELVTAETARKLDSLARRYEKPGGWQQLAGYGLLAFLVFTGLFAWMRRRQPDSWSRRDAVLFLPAAVLTIILAVNFTAQVGAATPLLLPLAALPFALRRWYAPELAWLAWVAAALLTAFALDWGISWLAIQTAGAAALAFWFERIGDWPARARAWAGVGVAQALAWLAAGWSGRLPGALFLPDVALFLLVAALLAVGIVVGMEQKRDTGVF